MAKTPNNVRTETKVATTLSIRRRFDAVGALAIHVYFEAVVIGGSQEVRAGSGIASRTVVAGHPPGLRQDVRANGNKKQRKQTGYK